ncbi:MAG: TrkA family potassium uptake protein [Paramuribaculum sp.]|nr:TrkA family potassium uptake protein [Paramuribaculum sp.]MDE6460479.1 TrkA family potassium uptake protein [Paramuribaculum sp.]MDE6652326.1 TrkA family potassium uptake protein [Paramuribaculum sp.]
MRYLIIGLGIYGSNLAIDLTKMGHEVIAADVNPSLVESIKDLISTAYIIDSTDEISLGVLPLNNVDIVIVAIGENFGASIKTVALLKQEGVKHIYARAIDKLHESILEGFNIDRILTPEQRAAEDLVHEMTLGSEVDCIKIDDSNYVLKFRVPDFMVGLKYSSLNLQQTYSLRLIAVTRPKESMNILGISRQHNEMLTVEELEDAKVESLDILTCVGTAKSFRELSNHITS